MSRMVRACSMAETLAWLCGPMGQPANGPASIFQLAAAHSIKITSDPRETHSSAILDAARLTA
jgi:hypothetical protein